MRRFWICPECGSLNYDFGIGACIACNSEIDDCDRIFNDGEETEGYSDDWD